jgi:hypothetical protein
MNKMVHFSAAAGMLSAKQNDELCHIYMTAKDCAECYFAGPEFVTRARNVKNAAEHAIRTQDPADYEHMGYNSAEAAVGVWSWFFIFLSRRHAAKHRAK